MGRRKLSIATVVLVVATVTCSLLSILSIVFSQSVVLTVTEQVDCSEESAQLLEEPGKPAALVSFPFCGAEEARSYIQRLTGVKTSTFNCENQPPSPYLYPCEDHMRVVGLRTSGKQPKDFDTSSLANTFSKVLFIARNPFDTMYVNLQRKNYEKQVKDLPQSTLKNMVLDYKQITKLWLGLELPLMLVRFEELSDNKRLWGRISSFLEHPASDERVACALSYTAESLKAAPYFSLAEWTALQRKFIRDELHREMCTLGYGGVQELDIICEVRYLQMAARRDEEDEERDRLREEFAAEQQRQQLAKIVSAPGMWYDGLRMISITTAKTTDNAPDGAAQVAETLAREDGLEDVDEGETGEHGPSS